MKNLKDKVITILSQQEQSRNSDIILTQHIWYNYYQKYLFKSVDDRWSVRIGDLFNLPSQDNIKRIRAKIQNEEHKYLPTDPEIRKKRQIKEEEWRRYLGYNPEFRTI
jgi:hypothetical protein